VLECVQRVTFFGVGTFDDAVESERRRKQWEQDAATQREDDQRSWRESIQKLQAEALQRLHGLSGARKLYVLELGTRFWHFGDRRFGDRDEDWRVVNELDCWVVVNRSNPRTGGPAAVFVPSPVLLLETGNVVELRADDHVRSRVPNSFAVSALLGATLEWMSHPVYSDAARAEAKTALARVVVNHESSFQ